MILVPIYRKVRSIQISGSYIKPDRMKNLPTGQIWRYFTHNNNYSSLLANEIENQLGVELDSGYPFYNRA